MTAEYVVIAKSAYGVQMAFQGLYLDDESGLTYYRARMYDATLGQFIERDPLGYPDGMNAYAAYHVMYGGLDPMGLEIHSVAKYYARVKDGWRNENEIKTGTREFDYEVALHKMTLTADTSNCSQSEGSYGKDECGGSSGYDGECTGEINLSFNIETTLSGGTRPNMSININNAGIYHPATEVFYPTTTKSGKKFSKNKMFKEVFTSTSDIDSLPCDGSGDFCGTLWYVLNPERTWDNPLMQPAKLNELPSRMGLANGYLIYYCIETSDCGKEVSLSLRATMIAFPGFEDRKLLELSGPQDPNRLPTGIIKPNGPGQPGPISPLPQ